MFVAFADTWQSCVYTNCTKAEAALKELSLKQISELPPGWVYKIS